MDDNMMAENKLSDAIRNYRKDKNLTQSALADEIGITSGYVSMIENDNLEKLPKKSLLIVIDFVLGLDATSHNPDSVIDCQSLEIAAMQDYRIAKILRAIQDGELPGALLARMISILERGYD